MKYVIGIVMILLLGCGSSEGDSATEMRSSGGGKADDVESSTDIQQMGSEDNMGGDEATEPESLADSFDYCGEFELYDDGDCHRFCHEPDPDCDGVPEEEDDFAQNFERAMETVRFLVVMWIQTARKDRPRTLIGYPMSTHFAFVGTLTPVTDF